jgi:molybdopterin-guanine dinucleotide biosynthesis protein A
MQGEQLTAIVLAGGRSSRMGQDKGSLPWGGSDLLQEILAELNLVCSELIVVSNLERKISLPHVRVVGDNYLGCGPLGGIQAGMAAATNQLQFIVACDMPHINSKVVAWMAGLAAGYDVVVPFVDQRYHPLHAIYRRRCLPTIEKMLAAGQLRLSDLYPQVMVRPVSAGELGVFGQPDKLLRNVNTPEDLI